METEKKQRRRLTLGPLPERSPITPKTAECEWNKTRKKRWPSILKKPREKHRGINCLIFRQFSTIVGGYTPVDPAVSGPASFAHHSAGQSRSKRHPYNGPVDFCTLSAYSALASTSWPRWNWPWDRVRAGFRGWVAWRPHPSSCRLWRRRVTHRRGPDRRRGLQSPWGHSPRRARSICAVGRRGRGSQSARGPSCARPHPRSGRIPGFPVARPALKFPPSWR